MTCAGNIILQPGNPHDGRGVWQHATSAVPSVSWSCPTCGRVQFFIIGSNNVVRPDGLVLPSRYCACGELNGFIVLDQWGAGGPGGLRFHPGFSPAPVG